MRGCPPTQHKDSTINRISRGDLEVVSLEINTVLEIVDGVHGEYTQRLLPIESMRPSNFLDSAHTTNFRVLERRQDGREELLRWPVNVIVHQHHNLRLDVW